MAKVHGGTLIARALQQQGGVDTLFTEASGLPALVNVHLAETMRMSSNYSQ